jgi:hypothetical protein
MNKLAYQLRHTRLIMPGLLTCLALSLAGCSDDSDPTAPGGEPSDPPTALTAVQDTYIDAGNANTNYGQSGLLQIGADQHAFLQFDLQTLPADAVVTEATLELTQTAENGATSAGSVTVTFVPADDWDEDAATANDPPTMGSEFLGSFAVDALDAGDRPLSFTSALTEERTGSEQLYTNRILSLRLSSNQSLAFRSGEYSDEGQRPRLTVRYADGVRVTLMPVTDAMTSSNAPDENYAAEAQVQVNRSYLRTFVKFDLSALPADAQLHLARFKMLASGGFAYGGDGNVYSHLVTDDTWSPETITASNEPSVVNAHCGFWWLWYDGTPRDAWGVNASPLLRPVVQGELTGDGTLSLRLHSPGYRTQYYRAGHEDETKRPVLEVVYTR